MKNDNWISVEDRLPKQNGCFSDAVLTYSKTGRCCVEYYDYDFGYWTTPHHISNVTHWQPLPLPPKSSK